MGAAQGVIVCGVDGSAASRRALRWAIDEAVKRDAEVHAVTAWSWDGLEDLGTPTTPTEALERAQRILDATVEEVARAVEDAPVVKRICERGEPSDALSAAACEADLLILGSHGHGTVHDKLLGSTSERTVHHAPCPVVIVPDPRLVEKNLRRLEEKRRRTEASHPVQVV
jgi:nucleotide-binding universal stress UspA family protein